VFQRAVETTLELGNHRNIIEYPPQTIEMAQWLKPGKVTNQEIKSRDVLVVVVVVVVVVADFSTGNPVESLGLG